MDPCGQHSHGCKSNFVENNIYICYTSSFYMYTYQIYNKFNLMCNICNIINNKLYKL